MQSKRKFDAFNVINVILFIGVLSTLVISMVYSIINIAEQTGSVITLIQHILTIIVLFVPIFLKKILKLQIPKLAPIIFYLFVFLSIYLGTFVDLYNKTVYWDFIIHFLSAFLLGFASMFFVYQILKNRTKNLNKFLIFIFVFVFSFACGAIWEVYEFLFDITLNLNMQKYLDINGVNLIGQNAILDTMLDIISNFFGAIISAIICSICSYKYKKFISCFKISKIKKEQEISQIEE